MVIWDREDYLKEADRQFSSTNIYRDAKYTKNMLYSIADKSNKILHGPSKTKYISEKEVKYFTFNSKNARKVIFCTIDP